MSGQGFLEKRFQLTEHGTNTKTEITAGVTTFMTMAYILAVNPGILAAAGMDAAAVFTATALSACVATLFMAFAANLPFALAPGMGLNAFFAFTVVLTMGYSWQFALTAVFLEGLIFLILTATNLREAIVNCVPMSIKHAISGGIGLFIAFIGFKNAGIVVANQATLVTLGNVLSPAPLVCLFGLVVTGILIARRIKGALLLGILAATVAGAFCGVTDIANFNTAGLFTIPSMAPLFFKLDFSQIFTHDMAIVLLTFLFVDMFDTVGTLIGVCSKAGLLNEDGSIPKAKQALFADAIGTTLGAVFGTSTVTTYVESAAGVAEGGRTGLTALTAAVLFGLALLVAPIFLLVPGAATAPALIIVGLFMMSPIKKIDLDDYTESIPAFLTIVMMPFTFSIAEGIAFGMLSFVILKLLTGRAKDIPPLAYLLFILFASKFFMH
ncbi:NCS2 family permease [Pseudodesulfovibrio senegalensis]|jgi:AGZA family xanthine/uracil permease-like MFS transporter|uniref:NCS2 family permease n=1 Tax=Pseudodesulfovibrio senegalensis TaxID=1721087 RepID=A0A6N6N4G0_9BACT|nr:NCS2 family permease [Pseudodesulfovibrio senegalensis]KAB1443120.1 NCS2 family permease [Pseudodesulfovibrio senegalensis]